MVPDRCIGSMLVCKSIIRIFRNPLDLYLRNQKFRNLITHYLLWASKLNKQYPSPLLHVCGCCSFPPKASANIGALIITYTLLGGGFLV